MSELGAPSPYRIFVCYRREDSSAVAGRIYEHLTARFGRESIFMDVCSIPLGEDFSEFISRAVASCQVLLVLIGEQWLDLKDFRGNRRIDDPSDFVRIEIEAAYRSGIPVWPILIDGAPIPRVEDLPPSLIDLTASRFNMLHRAQFQKSIQFLIKELEDFLKSADVHAPQLPSTSLVSLPPDKLIFVSYSRNDDDKQWLERVKVHLRPLMRLGRIELWVDTEMKAGDEWRDEIEQAVESCSVAVLLVSADFLASDFIYRNELPPLLNAAKRRRVRILPVIASSCSFQHSELARFQAVNSPSKPLDLMSKGEQENALAELSEAVRQALLSS
jgi:TIR domain